MRGDLDNFFKKSNFHNGDFVDELHNDRNNEEFSIMNNYLPMIDAVGFQFEVEEEAIYVFGLLCCTILNNSGSLLTRKE